MHKLVIFDIDGTLLDTEVAVLKGLQKCLAIHHNIEVDLKDLTFAVGMAGDEVFGHFGVDDSKGISYKKWIGYIDDFRNDIHIFDGIVPTLDKLQEENVKLAIATSKTRFEYDTTVESFGLNHYFDYVVTIDDVKKPKPNPEPLLKICSIANVDVSDALFLGDTEFDIKCAHDAHVDFGLAMWGAHEECAKLCDNHFYKPWDVIDF